MQRMMKETFKKDFDSCIFILNPFEITQEEDILLIFIE
jgi:hypothetical protein